MADRSMTEDQALRIASDVVAHLKLNAGQRFPRVDNLTPEQRHQILRSYAIVISRVHLPPQIFYDAADWLAISDLGDRQITPHDFKRACFEARDEWEQWPEKRKLLEDYREARQRRKNLELHGSVDGRRELTGEKPTQEAIEATKRRFGALRRRAERNAGKQATRAS